MKFYIHKITSICAIDGKFHKNPLFCLRDFQFFQTAVTNLSYRYDLRPCWHHLWLLHLPAGQCPSPPCLRYCQLRHPTSTAHWIGRRTVQVKFRFRSQSGGLIWFGAFCRNKSTAARSVMLTIWKNDWLKSDVVLTFHQNIIDRAVNQWRDRLHKCVRAKGGHFKHEIWTFWLFWLTPTALETHDLWVMLFKNS